MACILLKAVYILCDFATVDDLDLDDILGDLDNRGTSRGRGSGDGAGGKAPQRPKTSRGKEVLVSSDRKLSTLSTDSDLFSPLDRGLIGTHEEEEEGAPATKQMNVHNLEAPPATTKLAGSAPPEMTRRRQSSSITDTVFDDDDGDFLSDMGLGDEGSKNSLPLTTTTTRKRSVASAPPMEGTEGQPTDKMSFSSDDFFSNLGKKLHSFSMQEPGPVAGSGSKQEESEKGDTGGLQFGAYVPSSGVARKSSLKQHPEASVSEEDSVNQLNSLSIRPNTAPGKKAVRFAEDLAAANSPRPATTPGLQLNREGEDSNSSEIGPKSSVGGQNRRSTVSDFSFSNPDRFVVCCIATCVCVCTLHGIWQMCTLCSMPHTNCTWHSLKLVVYRSILESMCFAVEKSLCCNSCMHCSLHQDLQLDVVGEGTRPQLW